MIYRCDCCKFEQEFSTPDDAFRAGWDAPPHFNGFVCCNLCPAVCVVLGLSHTIAHEFWKDHGRTDQFLPDDEALVKAYLSDLEKSEAKNNASS